MSEVYINRNKFLRVSAALISGLSFSRVKGANLLEAEKLPSMPSTVDESYLRKGLNALARAHHMSAMAGHLGASLVAGYFIGSQRPDLDPDVYKGIEGDLDRVVAGESVFGAKMKKNSKIKDSELFENFPKEKPNESLIDGIAEALEKNIGAPRESGHNVIFASIAIHALRKYPDFATPSIVDGVRKLVSLFDNAHPGSGYYGKGKGRIYGNKVNLPEESDGEPLYKDLKGMAEAVFDEIISQDPNVHKQGYGGLVHVNNHAAAIADIAENGYPELVPTAIESHLRHLRLWRNLPNVANEFGPQPFSEFSPFAAEYWRSGQIPYDRALLTHRVKTMYGFGELKEAVDDAQKTEQAYMKLRYMM